MSVQWYGVAGLLYVELTGTLLLLIPFLKPATWKRIFNMPCFGASKPVWTTLFYATLLILFILFADSVRTMFKYGELPVNSSMTLDAKLDYRLQECRGQRNFYISGFTLFLILVIGRLVTLIYQRAHLEAEVIAIRKQAEQASRELQRRLQEDTDGEALTFAATQEMHDNQDRRMTVKGGKTKEKPSSKPSPKEGGEKKEVEVVGPSQEEYNQLQEGLRVARADLETMKKQAEATNAEYDRLAEEHQKLQATLEEIEGGREDKKEL